MVEEDLLFEGVKTDVGDQQQAVISGGGGRGVGAGGVEGGYTATTLTVINHTTLVLPRLSACYCLHWMHFFSLLKIITQAINPER